MSRLDTDQADRDAIADRRHERDLEHEPRQHRHPRCVVPYRPDPRARQAFQASVIDSVNAAQAESDYTMRLECPRCRGPVFTPRDSDRERLDCAACHTHLVTRRSIDGVDVQEIEHDDPK